MSVFAVKALQEVRARLAEADDEDAVVDAFTRPGGERIRETLRRREEFERYASWLAEGGVAERPPRRMPSTKSIADYHGLPADRCWRCWMGVRVGERAHLICRGLDGLDDVQNLAILCSPCHRAMPQHWPGLEIVAIGYAFRAADIRVGPQPAGQRGVCNAAVPVESRAAPNPTQSGAACSDTAP